MEKLIRKQIRDLEPYMSARRIGGDGDVWLNANESPFDNDYNMTFSGLNRYPECQPEELLAAYANYAGVTSDQVLTTRGADEGIELLVRTFCEPNVDGILFCPPTYGMYRITAETAGVSPTEVPLTPDWQLDLKAIEANLAGNKLVFVCSPNNPTGNVMARQDIESLLKMTQDRAVVVIDEAYIDFCPEVSSVELLSRYENLVILRTLSKAFALAGLRCGFALANTPLIEALKKVIAPYPVPLPVCNIALQALSPAGLARMKYQILDLNANRAYLHVGLAMIPNVTVHDGWGNYLLAQFPDSAALFQAAWDAGVILRQSPVDDGIRISVGNRQECESVLSFIRDFYC